MSANEQVNILIVDDNEAKRLSIENILAPLNQRLILCDSGKKALRYLLQNEVAMVILDVQMPDLDGFETARIIRKREKNEFLPIIFVTAYSTSDEHISQGYELGAVDFIFTPIIPPIFKAKVQVFIDLYRLNHMLNERNETLEKANREIESLLGSLKQKTFQLETANQELESFSYSVSHDLRALLRHIGGYAELLKGNLKRTSLDEKSARFLSIIGDSVQRMDALINDLLAFSRMTREAMKHQQVNMNNLVNGTIAELSDEVQDKDIEWICATLPVVCADPSMIKQVWQNLISNAVKYSSVRKKIIIEIGCVQKETGFEFFIKDNGVGFDPKYADKLFGVFQRLHPANKFEGTGIGLALVRKIISRHGGETRATGEINKGATFYFTLPVTQDVK